MINPKVSINILNWNKPDDTIECIESCLQVNYPNLEILVIDNHSSDNSVQQFKDKFKTVHILENPDNFGYAGGNNTGIRHAFERGADYVFILNNDTTLDPEIIRKLVDVMEADPQAGFAAPKVMYYDDRKVINSLGTSMDWLKLRPYLGECNKQDSDQYPKILEKDILVGCGLLFSQKTVDRIGLIDERFFIFHEEADWCFRNLKSGFKNLVVTDAVMYHKASKTMREFSILTHYYSTRNFLLLIQKNASIINRCKAYTGLLYLSLKHLIKWLKTDQKEKKMARAFFLGIMDYFSGNLGKCKRSF